MLVEHTVSGTSTATVDIASQILVLVGLDSSRPVDTEAIARALRACARDQLLGFARQLGVSGVTKLAKDALAGRIGAALSALRPVAPGWTAGDDSEIRRVGAKFDLGPDVVDTAMPQNIPWGYAQDRVTAMAVDPTRLYVYWEVTDAAIAMARASLGTAGADAWLNLRVYDITGRLFDGTNAHSYFDEGVDRGVRQWFFEIGKPTSTTCVEIGLKSSEGYFIKIARSGRVEFPRAEPEAAGPIEWLTVRTATGSVGAPVVGGTPRADGFGGGGGAYGGDGDWHGWTEDAGFPVPGGGPHGTEPGIEWRETVEGSSHGEIGRLEWTGPVHRSEWQAGPFTEAIDTPALLEHLETGEISMRAESADGLVQVVYGPWQVIIRGVGARAERRVLATWEYRRTVEVQGGVEHYETSEGGVAEEGYWEPAAPGSSERRYVGASERRWAGASERRWAGASELLVRGGSEVYMLGASERLFRGASERLFKGASERRLRGASERLQRGASERSFKGASEHVTGGAAARTIQTPGALGASENAPRAERADADVGPLPYPRPERDR